MDQRRKQIFWKIEGRVSDHLNMLRGASAIVVFISDERNLFFVDYPNVSNPNFFIQTLYFITGFAQQAIIGFFVLSGLLISSSIIKAIKNGQWCWKQYLTARLSRLLVVLIPALIIGAFWDQLGIWIFGTEGIYGANPSVNGNIVTFPVNLRLSFLIGPGNALFLQEILVPVFGSNGPLWTISYWFWYYLLFPLGLFIFLPNLSKAVKAGALMAALIILLFVGRNIALYFLIWLMGAALTFLPPLKLFLASPRKLQIAIAFGFTLLLSCLFAIRAKIVGTGFKSDLILAFFFTFLVYILLHAKSIQFTRNRDIYKKLLICLQDFFIPFIWFTYRSWSSYKHGYYPTKNGSRMFLTWYPAESCSYSFYFMHFLSPVLQKTKWMVCAALYYQGFIRNL